MKGSLVFSQNVSWWLEQIKYNVVILFSNDVDIEIRFLSKNLLNEIDETH